MFPILFHIFPSTAISALAGLGGNQGTEVEIVHFIPYYLPAHLYHKDKIFSFPLLVFFTNNLAQESIQAFGVKFRHCWCFLPTMAK
jgi:hypothetical protein